jgi:hypothetical protein
LMLAGVLVLVSAKRLARDNPYRRYVGWGGFFDQWIDRFIAWMGTLKYFTQPLSLVQDPGSYKIRGGEVRELIDGVLQPGDILLRGYDGYLDGVLIGLTGGGSSIAKHFSHAALYLGDLQDVRDKAIVARRLQVMDEGGQWRDGTSTEKDAVRNNESYYKAGPQRVLHAMTKGVFCEDILTFVRCDYLAVLRLPPVMQLDAHEQGNATSLIHDEVLSEDARQLQSRLRQGERIQREEVLQLVHKSALGRIGSCYDFQFTDGKTHNRFSCSEFVYYCFKSVHAYIGMQLVKHGFLGFLFVRESITPGDIFEAARKSGRLQMVWLSDSLKNKA